MYYNFPSSSLLSLRSLFAAKLALPTLYNNLLYHRHPLHNHGRFSWHFLVFLAMFLCAVSVGSAKYEPESGALVWRIDDFPTDREANGTLSCHLELSPSMEKADFVDKQCMMKYGVAGSCVSGASVWSLQIPTVQMKPPKKWVKYDTKFRYLIDMLPSSKYEIAGEDD